ncbi:MAG TPA: tryptophan 2,3-dioxygenase family protein, partial [Pyrinomonadaceae bacterium]|nr:tryptophan 2,3-dioxygenase family protein [Pyrinomonadaceae bacterium]
MSYYGDKAPLSYNKYLRVEELIKLQTTLSTPESHDELLFIITHQAYELWFKQILHELDATIKWLDDGRIFRANHSLRTVIAIEKVLVTQLEILETMAPIGFLEFRDKLNPASGFQSVQFREIEFISGLKNPDLLRFFAEDKYATERLTERLGGRTLAD